MLALEQRRSSDRIDLSTVGMVEHKVHAGAGPNGTRALNAGLRCERAAVRRVGRLQLQLHEEGVSSEHIQQKLGVDCRHIAAAAIGIESIFSVRAPLEGGLDHITAIDVKVLPTRRNVVVHVE